MSDLLLKLAQLSKCKSSFPWKKWEFGFRCVIRSYIPREAGGGGSILHIALTLPPPARDIYHTAGNFQKRKLLRISRLCGYARNFSPDMAFFSGTSKQFAKVFSRESFPLYGKLLPRQPLY